MFRKQFLRISKPIIFLIGALFMLSSFASTFTPLPGQKSVHQNYSTKTNLLDK